MCVRPVRALLLAGLLCVAGLYLACLSWPATAWGQGKPATSPDDTAPQTSDSKTSRAARELYRRHCQRCHEADGKGATMRTSAAPIPDFTNSQWQERRSNAQLQASILEGEGTKMVAFRGKFTQEQVHDLVVQIRTFAPAWTRRRAPAENDLERRFRELQKEMDDLREQLRELSLEPRKR